MAFYSRSANRATWLKYAPWRFRVSLPSNVLAAAISGSQVLFAGRLRRWKNTRKAFLRFASTHHSVHSFTNSRTPGTCLQRVWVAVAQAQAQVAAVGIGLSSSRTPPRSRKTRTRSTSTSFSSYWGPWRRASRSRRARKTKLGTRSVVSLHSLSLSLSPLNAERLESAALSILRFCCCIFRLKITSVRALLRAT